MKFVVSIIISLNISAILQIPVNVYSFLKNFAVLERDHSCSRRKRDVTSLATGIFWG